METQSLGGVDRNSLLFGDFDRLHLPPDDPSTSCCVSWGKRTVAVAVFAGSVVINIANLYLATNALASFSAGFSAAYAITCSLAPDKVARVRQVVLPVIGQTAMFALSQAWANDPSREDRNAFDNTIIACLGANLQFALGWLFQEGAVRYESQAANPQINGNKLHSRVFSYKLAHSFKILSSVAFGIGASLTTDPILRGISSFLSSFFVSQVAGEKLIDRIDHKIENDVLNNGTKFRVAKTALLTFAYLAQIACFVPWYNPTPIGRIVQMVYVGSSLGFFDGISDRSQMRRVEKIPVADLHELEKLPPPEKPQEPCGWSSLKYQMYRIWKVSIPLIAVAGILGFTLWQEIDVLPDIDSRVTLGSMLFGFLLGTGGSHLIDHSWDPIRRDRMKDWLMSTVWFSPRILGIDPLFVYYVMTNSIKMDGTAVAAQKSPYYLAAIILGWMAYGLKMGHEGFIAGSERIGNLQLKFQRMAAINGLITFKLYVEGQN